MRGGSGQSGRLIFGDCVPAQKTVPDAAASNPRLHPAARPWTHAKSTRARLPVAARGFREMADWLSGCKVTAAAMEATGIYWEAPLDALEAAGIRPLVLNAQHVKQVRGRKTDVGDSVWLARPSLVLPKRYRELRAPGRHRRQAAEDRARFRNRAHKLVDRAGLRVGGVLSDIFGKNGRRILDGLADGRHPGRTRPRHRHVRLARALRRMGRALSGQQRERRPAAERTHPEGQPGAPEGPRRVRARRLPNQGLPVPQPLPRPQDEEELQAGRLRHRPQAGPRDPCGPEEPEACTDPGTDCREIMARRNAPRWIRMMKAYGIE